MGTSGTTIAATAYGSRLAERVILVIRVPVL